MSGAKLQVSGEARPVEALGGAVCEQDGNAVEDGIAAVAAGAADGVSVESEGLAADRADQPAERFGSGGGMGRVGRHGARYKVLGSRVEVRGAVRVTMD